MNDLKVRNTVLHFLKKEDASLCRRAIDCPQPMYVIFQEKNLDTLRKKN